VGKTKGRNGVRISKTKSRHQSATNDSESQKNRRWEKRKRGMGAGCREGLSGLLKERPMVGIRRNLWEGVTQKKLKKELT